MPTYVELIDFNQRVTEPEKIFELFLYIYIYIYILSINRIYCFSYYELIY